MKSFKQLVENFFIFTFSTLLSRAITFVLLPIYSYRLSLDEYGSFELVLATVALLLPLMTISAHEGMLKYCLESKSQDTNKITFQNTLFIAAITSGAGVVILLLMSEFIFEIVRINFLVAFLMFAIAYEIFSKYLKGIGENYLFAKASVLLALGTGISTYLLVYVQNRGLDAVFVSQFMGYTISLIYMSWVIGICDIFRSFKFDLRVIKKLIRISWPLVPNALMWWVISLSDRWFISVYSGMDSLGMYTVSAKVSSLVIVLNGILYQTWQIYLYQTHGQVRSSFRIAKFISLYFSILSFGCLILISFSEVILNYFLSERYSEGWYLGNMLVVSSLFFSMASVYGVFYVVRGKSSLALKSSGVAAIINLLINMIAVPQYGALGAVMSTVISTLVMCVMRIIEIKKIGAEKFEVTNLLSFGLLILGLWLSLSGYGYSFLLILASLIIVIIRLIQFRKLEVIK